MKWRANGCSGLPTMPLRIERHCLQHDIAYKDYISQTHRLKADWELGVKVMKEGIIFIPLGIIMMFATMIFGGMYYGKRRSF